MNATPLLDLFDIEHLWTEEQCMVRDNVRRFARNEFEPGVASWYINETFPNDLIPGLGKMGVLGANLTGYGCAGLDATAYGLIMRELEYVDSGLRSFASVQGALCMYPIWAFGTEDQKTRFLPKMAAGEIIGCFGLTEPDSGSDPSSMRTVAKKVDGGYILNGSKMWITNSPIAKVAIVWAKVDSDSARSIRGFLVERDFDGFTTPKMKDKMSLRASWTGEIVLEDCFVPEQNMLPDVAGLKGPLSCLTQARYGISWGALGAALCCFETALNYANERTQFGKTISSFQLTQKKLVDMGARIVTGHLLSKHLADAKDAGRLTPIQVSLAKRENVGLALDIARESRSILGGNGIMAEYPIMRHAANLESVYTYEGTHEVHTLAIGRALTGHSAFS
ncbi:MAG: acyl-CoA dehydrogenase family protein [Myxococcota bacterium]|nr:acyl-CoA dehydrogenase family protein [Myxococcota bacterium]